ncbi:MAG: Asp-tRNA(Asn)/Glu-tRNA(Gln) amidotransferase A subunit family amidase [Gammaproteobacteria bacterium]|jgi:Asp-tRNA(Asn)/Glu-tRNA(Gln) amidotransferase A subunit family amidase
MSKFEPNTSNLLSACDARKALGEGYLSSQELVEACFARINELEESIGAWAHLDKAVAMEQARQADEFRSRGLPIGALHGIPIAIKDIIDTSDHPTEHGTVLHQSRKPTRDATLVSLLKEAGAVILGKTVTTELAVFSPGKTRNPHNIEHTPGGSSSGSAAAVSSAMVPLAVGTQTNGSVIRPASYCGVYGFKPSFARISRFGVLAQSPPLDTIGVFARSLEDLALIADVLMRFDAQDSAMSPIAPPCITEVMTQTVPVNPAIGFVRTPAWDQVEQVTKDGFRELIETANEGNAKAIDIVDLPEYFDDIYEDHRIIMEADLARSYADEYKRGKSVLSTALLEMIERGQKITSSEYDDALEKRELYNAALDEIFESYDAIITPATLGPAPTGLEATGNPVMNTIWTFCGMPAINLPLLQSTEGLPFGVQLVGNKDDDARLFRTGRWLLDLLND